MFPLAKFTVVGEPKAQPRPKAFRRGNFVSVYNPKTADEWKDKIRQAWGKSRPDGFVTLECPVKLTLFFFLPRPKSHYTSKGLLKSGAPKFCPKKPDFDNLIKAVADQLTNSGAWRDDAQVVISSAVKLYADRGFEGCEIIIEHVDDFTD
jgi:Holliday junction resolvase RusA-like endonuclease